MTTPLRPTQAFRTSTSDLTGQAGDTPNVRGGGSTQPPTPALPPRGQLSKPPVGIPRGGDGEPAPVPPPPPSAGAPPPDGNLPPPTPPDVPGVGGDRSDVPPDPSPPAGEGGNNPPPQVPPSLPYMPGGEGPSDPQPGRGPIGGAGDVDNGSWPDPQGE